MDAQALNDQLRRLYAEHWNVLSQHLPKRKGYSYPLLMDANTSYAFASVKLFVVGQQAFDWGVTEYGAWGQTEFDAPIEELMRLYRTFNRAENYKRTPFWDTIYQLQALLNPKSDPYGLMWSNLIRLDCRKARVPQDVEQAICRVPLLAGEIEITRPDVVVFFTGPQYDERLAATFRGVKLTPVSSFSSRLLARLEHPALPTNTFRTYHPGYLSRQGQAGIVVSQIAQSVRAA